MSCGLMSSPPGGPHPLCLSSLPRASCWDVSFLSSGAGSVYTGSLTLARRPGCRPERPTSDWCCCPLRITLLMLMLRAQKQPWIRSQKTMLLVCSAPGLMSALNVSGSLSVGGQAWPKSHPALICVFECVTPQEQTQDLVLVEGAGPAPNPLHPDGLQETDLLW